MTREVRCSGCREAVKPHAGQPITKLLRELVAQGWRKVAGEVRCPSCAAGKGQAAA